MVKNKTSVENDKFLKFTTAFFLLAQFAALGATFFILSRAINWPISLRDSADIALPRLFENSSSVMLGYGLYLFAAILLAPSTILIACCDLGMVL